MNINEKKALLDLYIMQSNRASTTEAVAMLTPEQVNRVEESIRSASPNMTTLERAALQGKLDGMTVEAIAEQLGRGRGYVYQAITSAIKQIIDETLVKTENKNDVVTSGEIYDIYHDWCDRVGMSPLSRNNFLSRMDDRGMWSRHATRGRRCLIGYRLKQDDDLPYPDSRNQDNTISYTQATIVGMDHAS